MQSACQISAYAHYARTPVLQLKQRTDDFVDRDSLHSLCSGSGSRDLPLAKAGTVGAV